MPAFDLGLINGDNWGATQVDAIENAITDRGTEVCTTAQRNTIAGARLFTGKWVFDSTIGGFFRYDGAAWVQVTPSVDVQVFTSSGTWTKPLNIVSVTAIVIGGGGGGGGGRIGAASSYRQGGGGGGGGGRTASTFRAAGLPGTVTVTIGAGGTSGTGSAGGSNVDGGAGGNGGSTSFGSLVAYGGYGGVGGVSTGGIVPGGVSGDGFPTGLPGAGASNVPAGGATQNAAFCGNGPAGGGAGGGLDNVNATYLGGYGGGTAGTVAQAPSTNGLASASDSGLGGGGGGGGNVNGVSGAGGLYGGGGGGGYGGVNTFASGAGGVGAAGSVIVISHR